MLHPCNLALHEVKVSSALKIIKVRLCNPFICILDPLQFYAEDNVSRLIRSQEQSLQTIHDFCYLLAILSLLHTPTSVRKLSNRSVSVRLLGKFHSDSDLCKKFCVLHPNGNKSCGQWGYGTQGFTLHAYCSFPFQLLLMQTLSLSKFMQKRMAR